MHLRILVEAKGWSLTAAAVFTHRTEAQWAEIAASATRSPQDAGRTRNCSRPYGPTREAVR